MYKTFGITFSLPENLHNKTLRLFDIIQDIYNRHINWIYETDTCNKLKAHNALYYEIKKLHPDIPVQYIQTTRDNAIESVKSIWSRAKRLHKNKSEFKKPYKKLYSAIKLDLCLFTVKSNGIVTFSNIGKRVKLDFSNNKYFMNLLQTYGNNCVFAQLKYNKHTKKFRLNICFKINEPKLIDINNPDKVLGIDLGLENFISTSDGKLIKAKIYKKHKRRYQYLRTKLQTKGTKSAKRLLKKQKSREVRFSCNFLHILSKMIVNLNYDVFVFENLNDIIRNAKSYSKSLNRKLSNWGFRTLITYVQYKAQNLGKHVFEINPKNTSRQCSVCNRIDETNRYKSHYICKCGNKMHSDINAAINIKNKFLNTMSLRQGVINHPYSLDVSMNLNANYVACLHSN